MFNRSSTVALAGNNQLYDLLKKGFVAVGFVTTSDYADDVVKVMKDEDDGQIRILARGIQYAGVPRHFREFPEKYGTNEREAFCKISTNVQLRWIQP